MLLVAVAFIPDQTGAIGEVVGAVPVDAVRERCTCTESIGRLPLWRPRIAQVKITMQMNLIHIEQNCLVLTDLFKKTLELLDIRLPFLWIRLAQHFLALLPAQPVCFEQCIDGATTGTKAQNALHMADNLGDGPAMT